MTEVKRAARVGERLREELANQIRSLRDPRAAGALVSRVELTDDLQLAKVYVRHELGVEDPAARRTMLKGLEAAAGRLRREIARAVSLRVVPELRFYFDEGPDAAQRIEELLAEIKRDSQG
ncbi:MAG: 30S ribosome-binding factor RbfA [Polyangiaceae bacterium]|nr:30S ribosome-binding factor RbfA [Polyangiaceae bacterium]